MLAALDKHGLKMVATYVMLTADMKSCPVPPTVVAEIDALKGRNTIVWLTINGKTNDELVVPAVQEIADVAARNGLKVALYPHVNFHTDTMDTTLRIMRKAGRPNLGVCFNLCHFLKLDDEANLEKTLREAAPHLMIVSVNGADSGDTKSMGWDKLIRPLGEGSFDNAKLLRLLDGISYKGPVTLQCFNIKLPAADHLGKSMDAWRGLTGPAKDR
jgi:sugar phosphate isomerase/epimerase